MTKNKEQAKIFVGNLHVQHMHGPFLRVHGFVGCVGSSDVCMHATIRLSVEKKGRGNRRTLRGNINEQIWLKFSQRPGKENTSQPIKLEKYFRSARNTP